MSWCSSWRVDMPCAINHLTRRWQWRLNRLPRSWRKIGEKYINKQSCGQFSLRCQLQWYLHCCHFTCVFVCLPLSVDSIRFDSLARWLPWHPARGRNDITKHLGEAEGLPSSSTLYRVHGSLIRRTAITGGFWGCFLTGQNC